MTIATTTGWDATHANINHVPSTGQASLYITGTADIVATAQDLANHPGAVLIDQSPTINSVDTSADVFDCETGAITTAELAQVIIDAQAHFKNNVRPGQRDPAVYCSRNNVTANVNALIAGGVKSCPLFVADFNNSIGQATAEVASETGPFPIIGRQYSDRGAFDLDVYSVPWLNTVSGGHTGPPLNQVGTVHSFTTNETANVTTIDGGFTWKYTPKA